MFIFAFPGTGKSTLAKQSSAIVDLEMSDIKYDNASVSHLTKEERKSVPRPIKDKDYRQTYIDRAYALEREGKTVLVAMNFLVRMLAAMLVRGFVPFHIYIPHFSLKEEYRKRYIQRGNNSRFIFEVMFIWYLVLLPFYLLSICLPKWITVLGEGETLSDKIFAKNHQKSNPKTGLAQTIS
ncbi:ATP-binding protein [Streptococcus suis]|uniref:ATP-binding protein n=1 Tax=Streptococcus suis TaxID=1307 RepID=UPI0020165122